MIVLSKDEEPPSSATEMATGGMSTKSTRRLALPVTQILEPPSISGQELP